MKLDAITGEKFPSQNVLFCEKIARKMDKTFPNLLKF